MLSDNNYLEFLEKAKEAVTNYDELLAKLSDEKINESDCKTEFDSALKDLDEQKENTVSARLKEIENGFDNQLDKIDKKIKKTNQSRDKAKSQGIKGRIKSETSEYAEENKKLEQDIKTVIKTENMPSICRRKIYYLLFNPLGVKERIINILFFIMVFVLMPMAIYVCIPNRRSLYLVGIYVAVIVVFGGIYLWVNNKTKLGYGEGIKEIRAIRRNIKQNKKQIKLITHSIKHDSDEAMYDLKSYDDDISKLKQERSNVSMERQDAVNVFNAVTKNILKDEIENARKDHIEELKDRLSKSSQRRKLLEANEKELALEISKNYEGHISKKHLKIESIDKMIELLKEGKAKNISEAENLLN